MKLAFYARPGHSCYPAGKKFPGQRNAYIGQAWKKLKDGRVALIHSKEPAEFEAGTEGGDRAMKHCQDGSLWPADDATARHCGVPFVDVEYVQFQWAPKPAPKKAEKAEKGNS